MTVLETSQRTGGRLRDKERDSPPIAHMGPAAPLVPQPAPPHGTVLNADQQVGLGEILGAIGPAMDSVRPFHPLPDRDSATDGTDQGTPPSTAGKHIDALTMTRADNHPRPAICGSQRPSWRDKTTMTIARFSRLRASYGRQTTLSWRAFLGLCSQRRQGEKDGPNVVFATFRPEPDGRVHRIAANLVHRTAIALDIEMNKVTGEVPPAITVVAARIEALGWAGACYTSHSHQPSLPRYRVVLPLSEPIGCHLPVVEVVAALLGVAGVLDRSKLGAASVFLLPSAVRGQLAQHETAVVDGKPIDAAWVETEAAVLLAQREAERAKQMAAAMGAAIKHREKKKIGGFDPSASLIGDIRDRLDIEEELLRHGYISAQDWSRNDRRYLYPGSTTGIPGVHVMRGNDGVDRVYSFHTNDPLAAGNLPSWCAVKAIDVVDVVLILDHGGDHKKGLRALAQKFALSTPKSSRPAEPPPPGSESDYGSTKQRKQHERRGTNGTAQAHDHGHKPPPPPPDDQPPAPPPDDEPPKDVPAASVEINDGVRRTIDELNERYMLVNEAGKAVIYQRCYDPVLKRGHFARLTTKDLQTFYMNDRVQTRLDKAGSSIHKTKANIWLNHRERRQFIHGLVFDPSGTDLDEGVLNLWQGFAVNPAPGDWSILRDHIKTNICCGVEEYDAYLMGWMARMVQRPAEQGEVAVVLKGKEGCGKGTLAKALMRIFGQHALGISHAKHLTGNFNGHLRDCVFLFADEAFYAGDKQHVGVLKSLITEPILTIEAKHQNAIQAANMLHILMASNEEWVVPAGLDARRFFMLLVSDLVIGDHRYFEELWAQMEAGGYAAMLHDLLALDQTGFNVRAVPQTAALQEQRKLSLPIAQSWWMDCLHRGYVFRSKLGLEAFFGEWHEEVSTELLFASHIEFANQRRERHPMSRETMGRFLSDMCGKAKRLSNAAVGEHLSDELNSFGHRERAAKVDTRARPSGYSLGKLDIARDAFTTHTKLSVEWEPEDRPDPAGTNKQP